MYDLSLPGFFVEYFTNLLKSYCISLQIFFTKSLIEMNLLRKYDKFHLVFLSTLLNMKPLKHHQCE